MLAPTLKRCLHTTALLRQEGAAAAAAASASAATASRKSAPTASASELANALRRVVGGARPPRAAGGAKGPNRDGDRRASGARPRSEGDRRGAQNDRRGGGGNNNDRRGGGNNDRRGNSSGDRRGAQGQGQEQRRRRPSVLRDVRERSGGGGTQFERGATTPALDRPLPPIEALIPRTEWSASSSKGTVPFSRIPYTTPSELLGRPDLDALVASPASSSSLAASSSNSKRTRPLRNAERALRYHLSPRGNNTLGPLGAPTPIARPGAHTACATQATAAAADGDKSIKEQSRDERMRLLDETVGGDYSAQLAPSLLKDSDAARQPQLKTAADALASNAELNVASRAWTLDVVRRIISRPSK
ncbi:hypothetical protein FA10DRAFT_303001 [Acaromyces ingoldii]|uniref:Uncharacterized protein n=1 Tax=Acaromyces ingoldii TaxID=215250 RepID=A0A316YPM5_9BASI|nr:hypothetical protein FA10DRAFT_303001 [Acaromyces ingoldii]PWN89695.1 hypothetical protein FA10DRAFT_303001 [Acaromyces ingoldii]